MRVQHTYNVGIYCRLSRDDNNGSESMSISNQRDMLLSYASERGWDIKDVYIDDGISGTTFERPDFKRMVQDIESGRINCVITKDLSRLGRNYVMTGQYTDFFFPQHNVRYIAINDNYDSLNVDNDIAPFKNILNEMYAKDISRKIRSSRMVSAKQGKFMGSKPPYGYVRSSDNKHKLVIDEEAASIVKRMFSMFTTGESARHIANIFNSEGIACPRQYYYDQIHQQNPNPNESNIWGSSTVMQLLKNKVYIGHMVQGKRTSPSFKSKRRERVMEDAWVVVENTHEPLVDMETWETVQKRMRTRTYTKVNSDGEVSLFSGFLRCADCGASMAYTTKRFGGREYCLYRCSRYANNGKTGCSIHSIALDTLTEAVLQDIKVYARLAEQDEEALVKRLICHSHKSREREADVMKKKMNETKKRLIEVENLAQKLFEERISGNVPDGIFKKMMASYDEERKNLDAAVMEISETLSDIRNDADDLFSLVDNMRKYVIMNSLDRNVLSTLVDRITVSEAYGKGASKQQDITIYYKFVGCLS